MREVVQVPMKDVLDTPSSKMHLMTSVRQYFHTLYHTAEAKVKARFRVLMGSTQAKDSPNKNRSYDRSKAADMIIGAAEAAHDTATANALAGDIMRCLSECMREQGMGLKVRKAQYERLTRGGGAPSPTPAE